MEIAENGVRLMNLPRRRTPSKGPIKLPDDFSDVEFLEQFRFRKTDFFEILSCLRLGDERKLLENGMPIRLRYGEAGHYGWVWSDQALMDFLPRLATPSRWVDLQYIIGGSRTKLSAVFNFMLEALYARYASLVCDMHRWKHRFADFAAQLRARGCPFDNLVCFVDGHFQPTARPVIERIAITRMF
jgi:hypothetical protein